jgi:signal transduction histidine kinase
MSDPANRDELESLVQQRTAELLQNNEALRVELQKLRQENAEFSRRLTAAKRGSDADRESRRAALNLMEDAVESRRSEQIENAERRRVEGDLRQADRRKDEFLATLAHELRNPLAPIRNSLHILRLGGADNGTVDRIHEMLERQVNHLVRLVDDLMQVSRITRGQIELRKEQVELAAVVRTAVEASKPLIEAARHQLAISLPAEPLTLEADPVRLTQVLTNLLNNAAKYTDAGGQIWLTVRRDESDVILSVRDNGIGIPDKMLPKVFELFSQIDRALGRAQGGLGIGLTLVKTLVESHGGSVEGRSEGSGRGSEFVVRLPLASVPSTLHHQIEQGAQHAALAPAKILAVDDNRDAVDSLAMLLRSLGVQVYVANDGQCALEMLQTHRPSVVLLDIGMPGMDGNEVARRARQLPEGREATDCAHWMESRG